MVQSGQTVSTGLLNNGLLHGGGLSQLLPQAVGILCAGVYAFAASALGWLILKYTVGIRVSAQEELEGLDLGEHGNEAYHGFVMALEPLMAPVEPRPAHVPPDGVKRYTALVQGVGADELAQAWSELCQPGPAAADPAFKELYKHVTTVRGHQFRFRGGDAHRLRSLLETVLRAQLGKPVEVVLKEDSNYAQAYAELAEAR